MLRNIVVVLALLPGFMLTGCDVIYYPHDRGYHKGQYEDDHDRGYHRGHDKDDHDRGRERDRDRKHRD